MGIAELVLAYSHQAPGGSAPAMLGSGDAASSSPCILFAQINTNETLGAFDRARNHKRITVPLPCSGPGDAASSSPASCGVTERRNGINCHVLRAYEAPGGSAPAMLRSGDAARNSCGITAETSGGVESTDMMGTYGRGWRLRLQQHLCPTAAREETLFSSVSFEIQRRVVSASHGFHNKSAACDLLATLGQLMDLHERSFHLVSLEVPYRRTAAMALRRSAVVWMAPWVLKMSAKV